MQRIRTIIVSVVFAGGMIIAFLSGWLGRAAAMERSPVSEPKPEPPLLTDAQVRTLGVMVGVDRGVRAGVRDALEKQMPWVRPSA